MHSSTISIELISLVWEKGVILLLILLSPPVVTVGVSADIVQPHLCLSLLCV